MRPQTNLADLVLPYILDVDDLAFHLRMSPDGVRALLRAGGLPGKKIGRKWIVLREALLRTLDHRSRSDIPSLHVISTHGPGES